MNSLSGKPRANLTAALPPAESEASPLMARARVMMIISALTTVLAIAAVITVIGYRIYAAGLTAAGDGIVELPKGAHVISASASAGRVVVLIETDAGRELLAFDIKTLKQTGRLRFTTGP